MAAPFSREVLERILEENTAERVRFQDKKTGIIDLTTASMIMAVVRDSDARGTELGDKVLRHCARSLGSVHNLLTLIGKHS